MAVFRLYIKARSEADRYVIHRLNVEADDFDQAASRAAVILDYWQTLTKLGVESAFIGGQRIQFNRLREKGGSLAPRLILTFAVDHEHSRHAYLSIAITDPIDSLIGYFLDGGPEPEEWALFRQHAIPHLRTRSGHALSRVLRASLTINARAADLGEPAQRTSGAPFDDFFMVHAWTHRAGSIDEITFEKSVFLGANELRASGALAGTAGPFASWDLSPTGTSGVLGYFDLRDYVSDLVLRIWYAQVGTSSGDVVWRLRYRTFVPGDTLTDEYSVTEVFSPVLGRVVSCRDISIPHDRVVSSGGIAWILERLGSDPADTQPNYISILGVQALYRAALP
jgi:hypothetical protein